MTAIQPYSTPQDWSMFLNPQIPQSSGPLVRPTSIYGILCEQYPVAAEFVTKAGVAGDLNDPQANCTIFIDPLYVSHDRETARRVARSCTLDDCISGHVLRATRVMNVQTRNDYMRVCIQTLPNGTTIYANSCPIIKFDITADNGLVHILQPGTLYADLFSAL